MSLTKVVWYVLRVKNMHPGSPSDPSGTAAAAAKPRYVYSILKPHGQSSNSQVRLLLSEAKPSYVYSILKPHGLSSKSPVRLLLSEAKPSYVYSILKPHGQSSRCQVRLLLPRRSRGAYTRFQNHMVRVLSPPQSWSKAVVCVSTPWMDPRSGYFLDSYF